MEFRIPEPCDERWESMERRPDGRFCGRCQHTVIDLSRMTRREAQKKLRVVNAPYVCVQLAIDAEQAVFRPEPRRAARWAGGLVLAAALSAGCSGGAEDGESPIDASEPPCAVEPVVPVAGSGSGHEPVAAPTEVIVPPGAPNAPSRAQLERTEHKHRPMVRGRMPLRR